MGRPAPRRAPPHAVAAGSSSCRARRADLNWATIAFRRHEPWVARGLGATRRLELGHSARRDADAPTPLDAAASCLAALPPHTGGAMRFRERCRSAHSDDPVGRPGARAGADHPAGGRVIDRVARRAPCQLELGHNRSSATQGAVGRGLRSQRQVEWGHNRRDAARSRFRARLRWPMIRRPRTWSCVLRPEYTASAPRRASERAGVQGGAGM
jgi:hypothetical protein